MINCNYFITTPDPWVKLHTEVGKKFAEDSLDLVCYHFYIEYWTLSAALRDQQLSCHQITGYIWIAGVTPFLSVSSDITVNLMHKGKGK